MVDIRHRSTPSPAAPAHDPRAVQQWYPLKVEKVAAQALDLEMNDSLHWSPH
jgi:hypothetical protein